MVYVCMNIYNHHIVWQSCQHILFSSFLDTSGDKLLSSFDCRAFPDSGWKRSPSSPHMSHVLLLNLRSTRTKLATQFHWNQVSSSSLSIDVTSRVLRSRLWVGLGCFLETCDFFFFLGLETQMVLVSRVVMYKLQGGLCKLRVVCM